MTTEEDIWYTDAKRWNPVSVSTTLNPYVGQLGNSTPLALTDQHVAALERAICAEGYDIHYDTSTGEFKLERKS